MSRFNPHENAPPIHAAAETWRDRCFLNDGSLFTEETDLWSLEVFDELYKDYSLNLDEGEGDFYEKLEMQLAAGSAKCKRLMAEVMWLVLLFSVNTRPPKKREVIERIWSWSETPFPDDHPLLSDDVISGLSSTGTAYNTHRWRELVYVIAVMRDFKSRDNVGRRNLLSDPWVFAEWLHEIPKNGNRQLRHILTHLMFPDVFERITSGRDKRAIISAYTGETEKELLAIPLVERDKKLLKIREAQEAEFGLEFDFYMEEFQGFWSKGGPVSECRSGVDWRPIDLQIKMIEMDRNGVSQNRRDVIKTLKTSLLFPSTEFSSTKKMGALEAPDGEAICLEYTPSQPNLWVGETYVDGLRAAGYALEEKPAVEGDREGRHSALSSKGFRGRTAWKVAELTGEALAKVLATMGVMPAMTLSDQAVDRWVAVLQDEFEGFAHFEPRHDGFDETETDYKHEFADRLRKTLDACREPEDFAEAYSTAQETFNLIDWRVLDHLRTHPNHVKFGEVIGGFATSEAPDFPEFVADMISVWRSDHKGSPDPARQIGEAIAMVLHPKNAIYFRRTVLDDLYNEAVGQLFPRSEDPVEEYAEELRFGRAVFQAFKERGLAPRNLMDVQSALWVVHNHASETPTARVSRETVEAAMDAYDAYKTSGKHGDLFDAFGDPRDYWVRSTRERPNQVYPTKPIIGFIRNKTVFNGGWGQKSDAAAQLHNAGFIIVDSDNEPVEPPERYSHLINDADRIRLCALNYYIALARERGHAFVQIQAGTLGRDLFLVNATANVCQALRGKKFQDLAAVSPPTQKGPRDSTTTTFTFDLSGSEMPIQPVSDTAQPTGPLNTILFGPPGTGKTFETAERAVRICDGEVPTHPDPAEARKLVMARYKALEEAHRIAFVTFHQSYGYEEFVEGLRPETQPDEDEAQSASGFRLVPVDGVLKRIAQRARQQAYVQSEDCDFSGRKVFKVSIGESWDSGKDDIREECFNYDFLAIGYGGEIDWSDDIYASPREILSRLQQEAGKEDATGHDATVKAIRRLRNDMSKGDIVIASKGNKKARAIGIVTGGYRFEDGDDVEYRQRREVDWRWVAKEGDEIDVDEIYGKSFAMGTLYRLVDDLIIWRALGSYLAPQIEAVDAPKRPYVLIIDEINRANISKVMGEMITLLEEDKREGMENALSVVLPHSKKPFTLPSNLHILGTMNTADRSIALLDTALRRRFRFEGVDPDPSVLSPVDGIDLPRVLATINARLEYLIGPDHLIGHAWMMGAETLADLDWIMATKLIPLMREYFHEDLGRVRAVLGGGNAFLEQTKLPVPPGLDSMYHEPRFRYLDRYYITGAYGQAAYDELLNGAGQQGGQDGDVG
ncbi:AAA family ATPase [Shimia abyssi]|uniref:Dynein-related subfamily AAA family protein n=1 Tax=Shimia abyssi TaxID=1662395 RepID=A0A2P8F2W0_9RHOB|nr:AAA family ATPase [Shimia abyssi]PSL16049.1 dynein-related subfamily AAA family protein [Shimia abyssi]